MLAQKYKDGILKIVSARVCDENSDKEAGEILALEKGKGLKISCGEGTLYIVTAQFPNSKKMNVEDYARGHEIELGVVLKGVIMFSYYFDLNVCTCNNCILLTLFASMGVKSTFSKYNDVRSSRGITAASAARQILDANGLQNIRIEHVSGDLTDHYSPNENVIRLSDSTYNSTSVAAIGVAAHECGHAVQHQQDTV